MRTAKDVYDRLRWDPECDAESVTVGYMDRFRGMLEIDLAAFSGRRQDTDDELWIPWHRVYYYKRDGLLIWDRRSRMDGVFGSV